MTWAELLAWSLAGGTLLGLVARGLAIVVDSMGRG
jgi:hypothetical protein